MSSKLIEQPQAVGKEDGVITCKAYRWIPQIQLICFGFDGHTYINLDKDSC